MEVSVQPLRMSHAVPYPAQRSTLGFAERLDDTGAAEASSFAARSAASAGLMFGGGTFAVLLFILAMVGLTEGQTVFQSQTPSFFARDTLKKLSGRPQATAKSVGRPPMVYHNGQTVAVVALGPSKTLLDCELIETYNLEEKREVLSNLSRLRPLAVPFNNMMELISKCQELAEQEISQNGPARGPRRSTQRPEERLQDYKSARSVGGGGALTVFQGIMPGTKWCGTGDIAETYYDLGPDSDLDMCCRSHDLCPVKVRAFTSRFNLTNFSIYSKSHCECDVMLYKCLKRTSHPNAFIIGNFYFNLLRVPCLDKQANEKHSSANSNDMQFKNNKLTF